MHRAPGSLIRVSPEPELVLRVGSNDSRTTGQLNTSQDDQAAARVTLRRTISAVLASWLHTTDGDDVTDKPPLKPSVQPGEYQCYGHLPNGDENPVIVAGVLSLQPNRPPEMSLHEEVPLSFDLDLGTGEMAQSFPQVTRYPALRVDLVNGLDAVLLDCTVEAWFLQRAHVTAAAALVGRIGPVDGPLPLDGLRMQITGSDAIISPPPLGSTSWPMTLDPDKPATWSVTERFPRETTDVDDDAEVSVGWSCSFTAGNGYQHRVSFSPVIDVKLTQPVELDKLRRDWIDPLHRLMGLATNREEKITYLALHLASSEDERHRVQVFGTGIAQRPYASDYNEILHTKRAFECHGEGRPTLLALCRGWQQAHDAQHPLIDTLAPFLFLPRQHPRPRYLLLVQALEGLHGHDNQEATSARNQAHLQRRDEALAAVDDSENLSPEIKRWLKKNVPKRPATSLEPALKDVVASLPVNYSDKMNALDLVQTVITSTDNDATHWAAALRVVRNGLSHGSRSWDSHLLEPAAGLLEPIARAHLMRVVGVPDALIQAFLHSDQG